MTQIYNVPLTQDQRDYLISLCATASDDDAVAQETLGECGLDVLEDVLRSAEPVQEDALQRLEKWADGGADRQHQITRWESESLSGGEFPYLARLSALDADIHFFGEGKSIEDAICKALTGSEEHNDN